MTIRREWDLERICLSALERPTAERAAFLIDACGCDEERRREAESLIARNEAAASFLECPPIHDALSAALAVTVPAMRPGTGSVPTPSSQSSAPAAWEVYRARDAALDREVAIKGRDRTLWRHVGRGRSALATQGLQLVEPVHGSD